MKNKIKIIWFIIKYGYEKFFFKKFKMYAPSVAGSQKTKGKITIKRKNQDEAWGVISINSEGSDGSVLKNLSISGGSSAIIENTKFSGMLSLFWNKNIIIQNTIMFYYYNQLVHLGRII